MAEEVVILMKDVEGLKIPGKLSTVVGKVFGSNIPAHTVLRGELLVALKSNLSHKEGRPFSNYCLKKDHNVVLYCSAEDVTPLVDRHDVDLLEGVRSLTSRHALIVQGSRLEWAQGLKVDTEVYLQIPSPNMSVPSCGIGAIRYIGEVRGLPGWQFGVEITDDAHRGLGTSDGTFGGDRYFVCKDNDGLFVSLDKISPDPFPTSSKSYASATAPRPITNPPAGNTRSRTSPAVEQESSTDPPKPEPGQFKMNERVMVFNKHGKEVYGRVRWCGDRTKTRNFGFTAVGIETETDVYMKDFEGHIPTGNTLGTPKFRYLMMPQTIVVSTEQKEVTTKPKESLIDLNSSASVKKNFGKTRQELITEEADLLKGFKNRMSGSDATRTSQPRTQGSISNPMSRQSSVPQPGSQPRQPDHMYEPIPGANGGSTVQTDHDNLHHYGQQQSQGDPHQDLRQMPAQQKTIVPGVPHTAVPLGQPQENPYADYANIPAASASDSQSRRQDHYNLRLPCHQRGVDHPAVPLDQNRPQENSYADYANIPAASAGDSQRRGQDQRQPHHQGGANHSHDPNHCEQRVPNSAQQHFSSPSPQPQPRQMQNPNPGSQHDWNRQQPNPASRPRATVVSSNPYNLGVESRIQVALVDLSEPPCYGVIRWIGEIGGASGTIAGIELDEYLSGCTDGTVQATGQKFFTCAYGKGLYFPLASLRPDGRFGDIQTASSQDNPVQAPMEEQADQTIYAQQMRRYIGNSRGIQGHQNSCYLDSTIFGLFALSDIFDTMFLDPDQSITSDQNRKRVADLLWKGIVNPLRKNGVVRFESVMKMRNALDELGKMEGITEKEKDPEEFLNMLFKHMLHTKAFISIRRPFGVEQEFFVQLFVEHDPNLRLPNVGNLLRRMFLEQHISFTKVPSKLLLQVPRFGREFQTYKRIVPELKLNIRELTDTYKKAPAPACYICGEESAIQCEGCGPLSQQQLTHYCQRCSDLYHSNPSYKDRANHRLTVTLDAATPADDPGLAQLDLLSVICIETSHYVCFTRDPRDDIDGNGKWIFFDSMADRKYDTYNIPCVTDCTRELNEWVYSGVRNRDKLFSTPPRELPELVRRFTQDIYMCVYVQPDVAMYGDGDDEEEEGLSR